MKQISRFFNSIGVIILTSLSVAAIFISVFIKDLRDDNGLKEPFEYITSFESRFYDYRIKTHHSLYEKNDEIVLVKIDDESLQKINSWPIPRENWAKLLDNLSTLGAKVVVFRCTFSRASKVMFRAFTR